MFRYSSVLFSWYKSFQTFIRIEINTNVPLWLGRASSNVRIKYFCQLCWIFVCFCISAICCQECICLFLKISAIHCPSGQDPHTREHLHSLQTELHPGQPWPRDAIGPQQRLGLVMMMMRTKVQSKLLHGCLRESVCVKVLLSSNKLFPSKVRRHNWGWRVCGRNCRTI